MLERVLRRHHWYVAGNPYQWRTWFRGVMPWCASWMFPKGRDCELSGSSHGWYNRDGMRSACYHCDIVREGRLWQDRSGAPPHPKGERRKR